MGGVGFWEPPEVPSGKRLHSYGKSPFLMGKSTISMAIFNSYVSHYQRVFPPKKKIKQIQMFFAGIGNPPEKVHIESNKCHSRKLLKWPLPRMTCFSLSNSNRATQDASWIVHLTILWEKLTSFLWGGTIQCPWLCWCSHYDIHSLKTRDLLTKPQKLQTLPCWIVSHPKNWRKTTLDTMYGSSCLDFKLSPKYV